MENSYDNELIFSGMIRYADFKNALADGKEKCLERLKIDLERQSLDDIHDSMSWWACFKEDPQFDPAPNGFNNNIHPTNFDQSTHKLKKKKIRPRKRNENRQKPRRGKIAVKHALKTGCKGF